MLQLYDYVQHRTRKTMFGNIDRIYSGCDITGMNGISAVLYHIDWHDNATTTQLLQCDCTSNVSGFFAGDLVVIESREYGTKVSGECDDDTSATLLKPKTKAKTETAMLIDNMPTKNLTVMNRVTLKRLQDDFQLHMKAFEAEHGINVTWRGCTYTDQFATVKIEISTVAADGVVQSREVSAFKQLAGRYGMTPKDLGRKFTHCGRTFKVSGLSPRSRRYPILAECVKTGKTFKFGAQAVHTGFKAYTGK